MLLRTPGNKGIILRFRIKPGQARYDPEMKIIPRRSCQPQDSQQTLNLAVGQERARAADPAGKALQNKSSFHLLKQRRGNGTDYIDVFMFLGVMKPKEFPEPLQEELQRLKEDGKVRAVGISCHNRKFSGELAARGAVARINHVQAVTADRLG